MFVDLKWNVAVELTVSCSSRLPWGTEKHSVCDPQHHCWEGSLCRAAGHCWGLWYPPAHIQTEKRKHTRWSYRNTKQQVQVYIDLLLSPGHPSVRWGFDVWWMDHSMRINSTLLLHTFTSQQLCFLVTHLSFQASAKSLQCTTDKKALKHF